MKIVFYSTRSNHFDGTHIRTDYFPLRADEWDALAEHYPSCEFTVAAKFPATYLFDMKGNDISAMPSKVCYIPLSDEDDAEKTAEVIAELKPDAAVVISTAGSTYDRNPIRDLEFPVIVKSTGGSGSLGVTVAETPNDVYSLLLSDENNADVIVEEIIQGEQFGTEIHGTSGNYHVLPPFAFSTTEQGITDPYTSVKFGPVRREEYRIKELQAMLLKMAESFRFTGATQVDLVYRDGEWYVIEINPRWSGMTTTAAAAECRSPYEIYAECALGRTTDYSRWENLRYAVNFKIPEMETEELARLYRSPGVKYIMETVAQRPGKPKLAVCEVVLGGFKTSSELMENIKALREKYPNYVSEKVISSLSALCEKYGDTEV